MNLPTLPPDKASHMLYGLLVFCVFGLFSPIINQLKARLDSANL